MSDKQCSFLHISGWFRLVLFLMAMSLISLILAVAKYKREIRRLRRELDGNQELEGFDDNNESLNTSRDESALNTGLLASSDGL